MTAGFFSPVIIPFGYGVNPAALAAVGSFPAPDTYRLSWTGLTGGDNVFPGSAPNLPIKTVMVSGVFDGASLRLEGTNDADPTTSPNWLLLDDRQGAALDISDTNPKRVAQNPHWIRPFVTNPGPSTLLNAVLICTRFRRRRRTH